MSNVYESQYFDMSFRAVSNDCRQIRIYTGRNSFAVDTQMSFDSEYTGISSVDYFIGSLVSSIMLSVLEYARFKGIDIEEIEGRLDVKLSNPLSLLHVQGYYDEPLFETISIFVYLYADMEEEKLLNLCRESLRFSPVYNTLCNATKITVSFKLLL